MQPNYFQQSVKKFISDDKFNDLNQILLGCIEDKTKSLCGQNNNNIFDSEVDNGIVSVLLDVNQKIKEYRIINIEQELDKLVRLFVFLLDIYILFKKDNFSMPIEAYSELETNLAGLQSKPYITVNSSLVDYICEASKRLQPTHSMNSISIFDCFDAIKIAKDASHKDEFVNYLTGSFNNDKSSWFDKIFRFKYLSLLASEDIKIYSEINQSFYKFCVEPKERHDSSFVIGRNYVYTHSLIFEKTNNQQIRKYIYDTLINYYKIATQSLEIQPGEPIPNLEILKKKVSIYLPLKSDIHSFNDLAIKFGISEKINSDSITVCINNNNKNINTLKRGMAHLSPTLGYEEEEDEEEEEIKKLLYDIEKDIKNLKEYNSLLQHLI